MNKVDILAIGVHPDDVELSCAGTLIKHKEAGMKIGVCDLTQGELGTRGSAELRLEEAEEARKIIGADFRINLGMADGFFDITKENRIKIIEVIRASQPKVLLLNALNDRHPDHGRSAVLEKEAAFLSGLRRIETSINGESQKAWRPSLVLHYIQDYFTQPDLVVDISEEWDGKMQAIMAFGSQFYNPENKEPESPISSKEFMQVIEGRALNYGRYIGATYGEGYHCERPLGVSDLGLLK